MTTKFDIGDLQLHVASHVIKHNMHIWASLCLASLLVYEDVQLVRDLKIFKVINQ